MLTLSEEFLILCIHESKGAFIGSTLERLKPGLGGAILMELAMMGRIQNTQNHRLQLVDDSPTGGDILDEALAVLKSSEKDRKLGYWIKTLSQKTDKFRKLIVESLVEKGVITHEDESFSWVIPTPLQPKIKASPKYLLIERLRQSVLASEELQAGDLVLLNLLRTCSLLDLVFLRDERKLAGQSINEAFVGQAFQDPVLQTIQEIETVIADLIEED